MHEREGVRRGGWPAAGWEVGVGRVRGRQVTGWVRG